MRERNVKANFCYSKRSFFDPTRTLTNLKSQLRTELKTPKSRTVQLRNFTKPNLLLTEVTSSVPDFEVRDLLRSNGRCCYGFALRTCSCQSFRGSPRKDLVRKIQGPRSYFLSQMWMIRFVYLTVRMMPYYFLIILTRIPTYRQ